MVFFYIFKIELVISTFQFQVLVSFTETVPWNCPSFLEKKVWCKRTVLMLWSIGSIISAYNHTYHSLVNPIEIAGVEQVKEDILGLL